jgi:hypothetical protein
VLFLRTILRQTNETDCRSTEQQSVSFFLQLIQLPQYMFVSLRQHGTPYFLFFVFALGERKNEKQ